MCLPYILMTKFIFYLLNSLSLVQMTFPLLVRTRWRSHGFKTHRCVCNYQSIFIYIYIKKKKKTLYFFFFYERTFYLINCFAYSFMLRVSHFSVDFSFLLWSVYLMIKDYLS